MTNKKIGFYYLLIYSFSIGNIIGKTTYFNNLPTEDRVAPIITIPNDSKDIPLTITKPKKQIYYTREEQKEVVHQLQRIEKDIEEFHKNTFYKKVQKQKGALGILNSIKNEIENVRQDLDEITEYTDKRSLVKILSVYLLTGAAVGYAGNKVFKKATDTFESSKKYYWIRQEEAVPVMIQVLSKFIVEKGISLELLSKYPVNTAYLDESSQEEDWVHDFRQTFKEFLEETYIYLQKEPDSKKQEFITNVLLFINNFQTMYEVEKKYKDLTDTQAKHEHIIFYLSGWRDSLEIISKILSNDLLTPNVKEKLANVLCFFSHHSNLLVKQIVKKNLFTTASKEIKNMINRRIERFQKYGQNFFLNYEQQGNYIEIDYKTEEESKNFNMPSLFDEDFIYNSSGWMREVAEAVTTNWHPFFSNLAIATFDNHRNLIIESFIKPSLMYDQKISQEKAKYKNSNPNKTDNAKLTGAITRLQRQKRKSIVDIFYNVVVKPYVHKPVDKPSFKDNKHIQLPLIPFVEDHYSKLPHINDESHKKEKIWEVISIQVNNFIKDAIDLLEDKEITSPVSEFIFIAYNFVGSKFGLFTNTHQISLDKIQEVLGQFTNIWSLIKNKKVLNLMHNFMELLLTWVNQYKNTDYEIFHKIEPYLNLINNIYEASKTGLTENKREEIVKKVTDIYYNLLSDSIVVKKTTEDERKIQKAFRTISQISKLILNEKEYSPQRLIIEISKDVKDHATEENTLLYQILYLIFYNTYVVKQEYQDKISYNLQVEADKNHIPEQLAKVHELAKDITKIVKVLLDFFKETEIYDMANEFLNDLLKSLVEFAIKFDKKNISNDDIKDSLKKKFLTVFMQHMSKLVMKMINSNPESKVKLIKDLMSQFDHNTSNLSSIGILSDITTSTLKGMFLPFLTREIEKYQKIETLPVESQLLSKQQQKEEFETLYGKLASFVPFLSNLKQETFVHMANDFYNSTDDFSIALGELKKDHPREYMTDILKRYIKFLIGQLLRKNQSILVKDINDFVDSKANSFGKEEIKQLVKNENLRIQLSLFLSKFIDTFSSKLISSEVHLTTDMFLDSLEKTFNSNILLAFSNGINEILQKKQMNLSITLNNPPNIVKKIVSAISTSLKAGNRLEINLLITTIFEVLMSHITAHHNGINFCCLTDSDGNYNIETNSSDGKMNKIVVPKGFKAVVKNLVRNKEQYERNPEMQQEVGKNLHALVKNTISLNGGISNTFQKGLSALGQERIAEQVATATTIGRVVTNLFKEGSEHFGGNVGNVEDRIETIKNIGEEVAKKTLLPIIKYGVLSFVKGKNPDSKALALVPRKMKEVFSSESNIKSILPLLLQTCLDPSHIGQLTQHIQGIMKTSAILPNAEIEGVVNNVVALNQDSMQNLLVEVLEVGGAAQGICSNILEINKLLNDNGFSSTLIFINKNITLFTELLFIITNPDAHRIDQEEIQDIFCRLVKINGGFISFLQSMLDMWTTVYILKELKVIQKNSNIAEEIKRITESDKLKKMQERKRIFQEYFLLMRQNTKWHFNVQVYSGFCENLLQYVSTEIWNKPWGETSIELNEGLGAILNNNNKLSLALDTTYNDMSQYMEVLYIESPENPLIALLNNLFKAKNQEHLVNLIDVIFDIFMNYTRSHKMEISENNRIVINSRVALIIEQNINKDNICLLLRVLFYMDKEEKEQTILYLLNGDKDNIAGDLSIFHPRKNKQQKTEGLPQKVSNFIRQEGVGIVLKELEITLNTVYSHMSEHMQNLAVEAPKNPLINLLSNVLRETNQTPLVQLTHCIANIYNNFMVTNRLEILLQDKSLIENNIIEMINQNIISENIVWLLQTYFMSHEAKKKTVEYILGGPKASIEDLDTSSSFINFINLFISNKSLIKCLSIMVTETVKIFFKRFLNNIPTITSQLHNENPPNMIALLQEDQSLKIFLKEEKGYIIGVFQHAWQNFDIKNAWGAICKMGLNYFMKGQPHNIMTIWDMVKGKKEETTTNPYWVELEYYFERVKEEEQRKELEKMRQKELEKAAKNTNPGGVLAGLSNFFRGSSGSGDNTNQEKNEKEKKKI